MVLLPASESSSPSIIEESFFLLLEARRRPRRYAGYVVCRVAGARDLLDVHRARSPARATCVLTLGSQSVRSATAVRGRSFVAWDAAQELMLCWDGKALLEVDVFLDLEHVGRARVDLGFLNDVENGDRWVDLANRDRSRTLRDRGDGALAAATKSMRRVMRGSIHFGGAAAGRAASGAVQLSLSFTKLDH